MERGCRGSIISLAVLSIVLLLLSLNLPFVAYAFEPDLEKELQQSLIQSRAVINRAEKKLKDSLPLDNEIIKLKEVAKSVNITNALMQERFRLRREEVKSLGAKAQERHRVMEEGYLRALEEYLALMEGLQRDNGQPAALSHQLKNLKTLLDKILPKKKRPIFGNLPYKNLNYPAREPDTSPAIKPAYTGGNKVVSPEDTKDTPEAPLSPEIATLAQSLNWNPVSIYEYVKNNIETEWYWGCMKGAEETLRQKSGNDCDQATLLTALLRASGFPSRYVRGVIEFPSLGHVKNLTGIDDPAKIADFFQKAGIPHKSIISAGTIANFQIEHIWVESLIPYSNYRGAVIDNHGKTWLGLDTSIKVTGYTYNTPLDVFEGRSFGGLRDEYLGAVRTETPLEYIGTYVENYLNQNHPGMTYNDVLRTRALIPEVMNILPASMQYDQLAVTHEYTEIPDDLRHKIKLTASDTDNNELFTISFDSLQLSNRKVILSYEPETVEDQQTIDYYGGLDNTPAYLIRLRPVLELDGEMVAAGKDGLPMGTDFNLTIELISPNGTERITSTQITGNLSAIGFVAQKALDPDQTTISEEDDAETILFKETNRYIDNWNKGEDELASLLHLQLTRPVPTVTTIGGAIDVTYLLDIPHGFEWKGVYVDAKLRAVGTVGAPLAAPASENSQKTFMQLSALQGSILENRLFEDDFQVESISTAKLFQIVGANGNTPFLTVDKANIDTVLSAVELDDNIKEDITNAVNQGLVISIPSANGLPLTSVSYKDWTGIGYIKENPATGEAGYMLSGIIAGGMTVITPEQWAKQYLMEKLSQPYVGQYNYNPLSATKIIKIGVTDNQTGVVGKTLAKEIAVLVLDANGIPVKGARVTFKVAAGGGNFGNDFWGSPKTESESKTGSNGIAKAPYILGQETSANPIYRRINSSDEFVTQVGLNLVTASVKTSYGSVSMQGHFSAHGKPDIPKKIEKILGQGNKGIVNNPGGSLIAKIVDQYGNSISNLSIKFKTISTKSRNDSIPLPSEYRSLEFYKSEDCDNAYPIYGECATVKEINVKTEYFGAIVNTMMGNTVYTKYYVEAKNVDYDILSAFFELYTTGYRKRNDYIPPGLYISGKQIVNDKGEVINAAKAGTALKEPLTAELYMLYDEYTMEGPHACSGNKQSNCWTLKPTGIVNTVPIKSGTVNFSVIQGGGTLSATENLNNGKYRSKYTTDATPMINSIEASGEFEATVPVVLYDPMVVNTVIPSFCGEPDGTYDTTKQLTITEYSGDRIDCSSGTCKLTDSRVTLKGGQQAIFYSDGPRIVGNEQKAKYTVFGVLPEITGTEPAVMFLDSEGYLINDTKIKYTIKPQEYNAIIADIDIFERVPGGNPADDLLKYWLPGNATQGDGTATIFRGTRFDSKKEYYAQVVLNKGSEVEVRGEKKILPFNTSALIPDYNRDGIIDYTDRERAVRGDMFYFWINDDDDEGETEGTDIPGATNNTVEVTYVNYEDNKVDGIRDLIDFFPVYFDIKSLLSLYSPLEYSYRLVSEDESINFVYTYIKAANSRDYLTGGTDSLEPAIALGTATTYKIGLNGISLDPAYLEYIKNAEGLGVLLFEGRKTSTKPLELRIYASNGAPVASLTLNLSLDGVEQMFRHKNLTLDVKADAVLKHGSIDGETDRPGEPTNCPDVECLSANPQNIKNFVFLHGYNVNGQQARGWQSEIFKRMYWSGSRARFWGVTWYGWDSQIPIVNETLDFYGNVLHAFETAPELSNFLKSDAMAGEKIVAAHSLGNMVVSSAIADYNAPVDKYFLLNAAIALEAFDETETENSTLLPLVWNDYDPMLRASEWYKLFKGQSPPDFKEQLTWRNRFEEVRNIFAYNYHSKGDEVVSGIWEKAERLKGAVPLISPYGGWEFNSEWDVYDPAQWKYVTRPASQANLIEPTELMIKPFFNRDGLIDSLLTAGPPTNEGERISMRNELLARAFPATTAAIGRSSSKAVDPECNIDMQAESKTDKKGIKFWPADREGRWRHSDIKNVAYPYVFSVFDDIVKK